MTTPSDKPAHDTAIPTTDSEPGRSPLGDATLEQVRETLLAKRAELTRRQQTQLDTLLAPDKHHLADLEEMSSDTVDTDSACAIVDLETDTLERIDTALEKIEAGSYGLCETCKKSIAPTRLEALPFAALCIDCQREAEKDERSR